MYNMSLHVPRSALKHELSYSGSVIAVIAASNMLLVLS